jgi:hypothetical protein
MKALYLLLLVSGSALADDAAILKCRSIEDPAARLGCYDAIQPGTRGATAAAPAAPPMMAAAAPAVTAPARNAAQDFGLEEKKKQEAPTAIDSTIVGTFSGWGPGAQIALANGQVWRVIDNSDATLRPMSNPKARVERNYFGTLFMVIEGTNHSPKVRRVK